MLIAAIILLVLALISVGVLVTALRNNSSDASLGVFLGSGVMAVCLLAVAVWAGYMAIMPGYRLNRAEIEKRILVEQAKAEADAAIQEARGEVERAKGTAEANLIVADSITEPYLRYLYINSLRNTDNQVIYLPTEAGLPVLEADRLNQK
jgi:hypothetical protein